MDLKARVVPEAHAAVDARSAKLGVTMSEYLEALVLHDAQSFGPDDVPTWWTRPVPCEQEELPLSESA
jgi:hypothetical protein